MLRRNLGVASALVLLAACDGSTGLDSETLAKATPCNANAEGARVVVAVIDSAFNPYHEFYHANSPIYPGCSPSSVTPEVLAEIGVPPGNIIELSRTGNIVKDKKADEAAWNKVRRGKPYWFKGTNLIGVSFATSNEKRLIPEAMKNPHGVGVTAAVLAANPDAVIVFTETWDNYANDDAAQYAFSHPAVDMVNSSYGYCVPVVCTLGFPSTSSVAHSYDGVVKLGKLHFQSSGNEPGITPIHGGQGSWWEIGVGGIEEFGSQGQTALARNLPDFVSDFTQELPYCQDCERGLEQGVAGTSFSSPRATGVASKILLEARRALNHSGGIRIKPDGTTVMAEGGGPSVTNWQMRRALEVAAYADHGAADYDPTGEGISIPINDAAPWLQVAWGELTTDPAKTVVAETLAQLGFGTPARSKDMGFCEFQAANMRFRQNFWDAVAASGDGVEVVPDPNPYLFCDSAVPAP